jgi:signal transduction histidine kinase
LTEFILFAYIKSEVLDLPSNIRDEIEFIILRAISGATETIKYHLRHEFGDAIEEKTEKDKEKIKQVLAEERIDAEQRIESEIVDAVEKEVRNTIRKIRKRKEI